MLYGAEAPSGPDRVTTAVTTTLSSHGFTDVALIEGRSGIGVTARVPE